MNTTALLTYPTTLSYLQFAINKHYLTANWIQIGQQITTSQSMKVLYLLPL